MASYEMAFRLQTSAPELMDLQQRTPGHAGPVRRRSRQAVVRPGVSAGAADDRARRAFRQHLSRRLGRPLRRGRQPSRKNCGAPIRPRPRWCRILKQRGLLDDTLVIWGGEFGRTPMVETNPALGRSLGRDHHPQAYTMWLAGGGVKRGMTLRRDRRTRLQHRRGPGARSRPAGHDPAPARLRPRAADVPLRGARFPADRRSRPRRSRDSRVAVPRRIRIAVSGPK